MLLLYSHVGKNSCFPGIILLLIKVVTLSNNLYLVTGTKVQKIRGPPFDHIKEQRDSDSQMLLIFKMAEMRYFTIILCLNPGSDPGFLVKGVHMYKGVEVRFADFISFFLNIP